jgi:microcystin-dependent protein
VPVYGSKVIPTGAILPTGGDGSSSPGYLLCDGTSHLVASFPSLWAKIGYKYGGGGASFNVPDMRGRFPMGPDNMGTGGAGRVPSTNDRGQAGGSQTKQSSATALTVAQLPDHTHNYQFAWSYNAFQTNDAGGINNIFNGAQFVGTTVSTNGAGSQGHDHTIDVMSPFQTAHFMIKT